MDEKKAKTIKKVIAFPFKVAASAGLLLVGECTGEISKALTGDKGPISKICGSAVDGIWGLKSKDEVLGTVKEPFEDAFVQYAQAHELGRKNMSEEEQRHLFYELSQLERNDKVEIDYFVGDENGITGRYSYLSGAVEKVSVDEYNSQNSYIIIDGQSVPFYDISSLRKLYY